MGRSLDDAARSVARLRKRWIWDPKTDSMLNFMVKAADQRPVVGSAAGGWASEGKESMSAGRRED